VSVKINIGLASAYLLSVLAISFPVFDFC
jgi:hypothetical protein